MAQCFDPSKDGKRVRKGGSNATGGFKIFAYQRLLFGVASGLNIGIASSVDSISKGSSTMIVGADGISEPGAYTKVDIFLLVGLSIGSAGCV